LRRCNRLRPWRMQHRERDMALVNRATTCRVWQCCDHPPCTCRAREQAGSRLEMGAHKSTRGLIQRDARSAANSRQPESSLRCLITCLLTSRLHIFLPACTASSTLPAGSGCLTPRQPCSSSEDAPQAIPAAVLPSRCPDITAAMTSAAALHLSLAPATHSTPLHLYTGITVECERSDGALLNKTIDLLDLTTR
jgi:hypothetical protein